MQRMKKEEETVKRYVQGTKGKKKDKTMAEKSRCWQKRFVCVISCLVTREKEARKKTRKNILTACKGTKKSLKNIENDKCEMKVLTVIGK